MLVLANICTTFLVKIIQSACFPRSCGSPPAKGRHANRSVCVWNPAVGGLDTAGRAAVGVVAALSGRENIRCKQRAHIQPCAAMGMSLRISAIRQGRMSSCLLCRVCRPARLP